MIDEKFAKIQIRRFSNFPRFPKDIQGQKDLVAALTGACESEDLAREVCDYLSRTLIFSPVPANFYKATESLAQARAYQAETPSLYKSPGETEGSMTDNMTDEYIAGWQERARNGKTKAVRGVAEGVLKDYFDRKNGVSPDESNTQVKKQQPSQDYRELLKPMSIQDSLAVVAAKKAMK